jgi:hypothetical protein
MARIILAGLLGPPLLAVLVASGDGREDQGPVYSVAEVLARLGSDPGAWAARAVRVRGVAEVCQAVMSPGLDAHCTVWPPVLRDPGAAGGRGILPLAWGQEQPGLTWLRGLPLLDRLVSAPPAPHWGVAATYRVRLATVASAQCSVAPCYQALLLDAKPGALGDG